MANQRNFLILSQYREGSVYEDLTGVIYHFPAKYKNQIQPGCEFIYYEPGKAGSNTYYGCGKIGHILPDSKKEGNFFAHIAEYRPFAEEVPLRTNNGDLLENPSQYNQQNAVRYTDKEVFEKICGLGGIKAVHSSSISFKTRARTVDMLGRQQIAGIPTAINELFKNAHDAYADNVVVDYYTSDGLFVLRDDGMGMTLDDFTNRWLTLGTDSKVDSSMVVSSPQADPTKEPRPSMGEKGIGRLAISIIGPQVLVLTRAKRFDEQQNPILHDTVVAFINWKMFEIPGVNIDEIAIPIRTFKDGTLPNKKDIEEMVDTVKENLDSLKNIVPSDLYGIISSELNSFLLDPEAESNFLKKSDIKMAQDNGNIHPLILSETSGTHFYITPSDPIILEDLNVLDASVSKLKKHLCGFTNTMTPGHKTPAIKASFREHNKTDDLCVDIINENEFFTPADFFKVDHRFYGHFDEYGQFHGYVSMYNKEPVEYHLPWKGNAGKETLCGRFSIDFANIMGSANESSLPAELHEQVYKGKMKQVGGLYIYKNGIRVLPYGDNDFDFLEMEKRRSMNAGTAFFSYRRIFGAIEINQDENSELREKAGREGFQENKAYRQFKDMLINFLKRVAEDFTSDKGIYSDAYIQERDALKKQDKARLKREKSKQEKLSVFLSSFKTVLNKLQQSEHVDEVNKIKKELSSQIEKTLTYKDSEAIASKMVELEGNFIAKMATLEKSYNISRPQGTVIKGKKDSDLWIVYQAELNGAEEKVFEPAKAEIEQMITNAIKDARIEVDRRRRIEKSLTNIMDEAKKTTNKDKNSVLKSKDAVESRIKEVTRESLKRIEEAIRGVSEEFNITDFSGMSEEQIALKRIDYESRIDVVAKRERKTLETVQTLLDSVSWDFDEDGNIVTDLDIYETNERSLFEAQDQMKLDAHLAQIGTAVNIINHEFDSTIRTVRRSLGRLKAWADVNEGLADIYNDVRFSFEHIDGYLSMFAPLNRRLYRKQIPIYGHEISRFIVDLFKVRMERHGVKIVATDKFNKHSENGYPSTFFPAFVNLVDNAIYWLNKTKNQDKTITLDVEKGSFVVSDNGYGIRDEIKDKIFDLGFSAKDGGRGMGLYIARDTLGELGFDLSLADSEKGAKFVISKMEEAGE